MITNQKEGKVMTNQKTTNQKKEKSDDQPDANQSEGRKVMTN
jgi:hypothetical protein